MLTEELITLLPRFVDQRGPSHDEISRIVKRSNLEAGDPARDDDKAGKVMRVRSILSYAIDHKPKEGERFVILFVSQVKARGGFRMGLPDCPGQQTVDALKSAFRHVGFDLDAEGNLRPTLLENLEGADLTEALWAYVRRAQTGAGDSELVIGTAKNLEEATVRHVLRERTGSYETSGQSSHFPVSLYQAYYLLGLSGSELKLDPDPYKAIQQALFLLACAVNRLRNERGDGHGRPEPSVATMLQGRLSSQSAGLVAELLLTALKGASR